MQKVREYILRTSFNDLLHSCILRVAKQKDENPVAGHRAVAEGLEHEGLHASSNRPHLACKRADTVVVVVGDPDELLQVVNSHSIREGDLRPKLGMLVPNVRHLGARRVTARDHRPLEPLGVLIH